MLTTLFRSLRSRKSARVSGRPRFRPTLEVCEDRCLLASFTWFEPVDGDFSEGARWRNDDTLMTGVVPGPNDDTNILGGGNQVTVTQAHTVNSLTNGGRLRLMGDGRMTLEHVGRDSSIVNLVLDPGTSLQVNRRTTIVVGSDIAGTLNVSADATLRFLRGDNHLNAGTTLIGTGQYHVLGDTFGGPALYLNTDLTAPANFLLATGLLTGTGLLTIPTGVTSNWTGVTMAGTGVTEVNAGGTLNIGGGGVTLNQRTLNNAGTVHMTGTGRLSFQNGPTINNLASGTFNLQVDQDLGGEVPGTFNNAGTFNKTSPVGTGTSLLLFTFNNSGTVNVTSGELQFSMHPGTSSGTFNVAASGLVNFNSAEGYTLDTGTSFTGAGFSRITGGDVNVNGDVAAVNFGLDGGTLTGSGTLTVTGALNWTGGTMGGSGTTHVPAGASLAISGNFQKILRRTLSSASASAVWSGTGVFFIFDAQFVNSGTFTVATDADLTGNNGRVVNTSTWVKTSPTGTGSTVVQGVEFNNSGTVNVQNGVLQLVASTGTSSGTFNVAASGLVNFNSPEGYTLDTGTSFTGAGFSRITGGSVNVNGDVTAANFGLDSGSLTGSGTLTVTGTFDWTGGTMADTNGVTAIAAGTALSVNGNANKTLNGRTLNVAGTATWIESGNINLFNNATINVLAGGAFNIDTLGDLTGTGFLNNTGTLTKTSAVGGQTDIANGIEFNTAGTVNVQSGRLNVIRGYIQNGGTTTISAGATLLSAGGVEILGGTLSGSGTLQGNVINAGTINVGGAGAAGMLTINGNYTQRDSGVLNLEIGGTDLSQYDRLVINGTATLDGTLNVVLIGGFVPSASGPDTFRVLTCDVRGVSQFATITGLDLGGGLMFDPQYDYFGATGLTLVTTQS